MFDAIETIEYRGYTIDIFPDFDPINPFTDYDGEPPLVAAHDRSHVTEYGLDTCPPALTREQIKANARDIARALGDYPTLLAALAGDWRNYRRGEAADCVNDAIAEYAAGTSGADLLEFLAECYAWAGITAVSAQVTGHVQSAWAHCLAVATPQWLERTGVSPADAESQLRASIKLYGQWAFGDVYGYTVTDPAGEDAEGGCWGFYGFDWEANGLLEHAREDIDAEITARRAMRQAAVKTWIRNRVPLAVRAREATSHA